MTELSLWTLTVRSPEDNVLTGDYYEMQVVAQDPESARQWAYRRAVLDGNRDVSAWRSAHDLTLSVLFADEMPDDAETGVTHAARWDA